MWKMSGWKNKMSNLNSNVNLCASKNNHSRFRRNFEKGLEREGAHLTVIKNGKVIINLWNGYSDSESLREWNHNTKTVLFSTTKVFEY